jgi:hypothetical protein
MSPRKDIAGQRFGRLVAVEFVRTNRNRKSVWKVKCDCGKEKEMTRPALMAGAKSCGCYMREVNSKPGGVSTSNRLFYVYKRNAERRGVPFNLSRDEFEKLVASNCVYCDARPENVVKSQYSNGDTFYNGIDRVNNSVGYAFDNCVPCCSNCNYAKRKMSVPEFFSWVRRVVVKSVIPVEKFGGRHVFYTKT